MGKIKIETVKYEDLSSESLKTRKSETPRIYIVLNPDGKVINGSEFYTWWNGKDKDTNGNRIYRIAVTTWNIDKKDIENYYGELRNFGKYFTIFQLNKDDNQDYIINL